ASLIHSWREAVAQPKEVKASPIARIRPNLEPKRTRVTVARSTPSIRKYGRPYSSRSALYSVSRQAHTKRYVPNADWTPASRFGPRFGVCEHSFPLYRFLPNLSWRIGIRSVVRYGPFGSCRALGTPSLCRLGAGSAPNRISCRSKSPLPSHLAQFEQ